MIRPAGSRRRHKPLYCRRGRSSQHCSRAPSQILTVVLRRETGVGVCYTSRAARCFGWQVLRGSSFDLMQSLVPSVALMHAKEDPDQLGLACATSRSVLRYVTRVAKKLNSPLGRRRRRYPWCTPASPPFETEQERWRRGRQGPGA